MHYKKCQAIDCVEQLKHFIENKLESQGDEPNETETVLLKLIQGKIAPIYRWATK